MSSRSTGRATLLVLLAAVLFGTTGTAQELGPANLDPLAVGAVRVVLAGAVLAALARVRGAYRGAPPASRGLVAAGAVGVALYQIGFFSGVRLAGVAVGTVVALGSCPVWAGLIEWIVRRRPPGPRWAPATALAVAGIAVLVLTGPGAGCTGALLGVVPALAAGLGYGIYTVAGARLIAVGQRPDGAMGLVFGASAVLLLPVLALRWPGGLDSPGGLIVAGYLALVPTVLAYLLFGAGLRVLPASVVATLNLAEPVVAAGLGVVRPRRAGDRGEWAGRRADPRRPDSAHRTRTTPHRDRGSTGLDTSGRRARTVRVARPCVRYRRHRKQLARRPRSARRTHRSGAGGSASTRARHPLRKRTRRLRQRPSRFARPLLSPDATDCGHETMHPQRTGSLRGCCS